MIMPLPFVIDNLAHRLVDTLNDLLGQSAGKPLDIATAYFSISGYRIVKDGLHKLGAFRLLLSNDPKTFPSPGFYGGYTPFSDRYYYPGKEVPHAAAY